jgi:hypothetical protein
MVVGTSLTISPSNVNSFPPFKETIFFASSSWVESFGVYTLEITHNLNAYANTVSVLNNSTSHEVEFAIQKPTSNTIVLESNIEPLFEVLVTVIK